MLLTIFTPTYNRAKTLEQTFKSLCRQQFFDFEWLIIDDGSTDNTTHTVQQFIAQAPFSIRYYQQEHGGKHRAYNHSLALAMGDLFFAVDSDDYLPDGCLITIANCKDKLLHNTRICGIIALKESPDKKVLGKCFSNNIATTTLQELEKNGCNGERSFVFKTNIARQYPFPIIDGEHFVTESVVYDRIGANWSFLTLNHSLTVCEYHTNGLSSNIYNIMMENPIGFMIYHYQRINNASNWCNALRHALRYHAFRTRVGNQTEWSSYHGKYAWIVKLTAPIGILGKCYYKRKCQ